MNRRIMLIVAFLFVALLGGVLLFAKGHVDKTKNRLPEKISDKKQENKEDPSAALAEIQEKMAQGDYSSAKKMCLNVLESAESQDELELAEELLKDINFKLIISNEQIEGKTIEYEVQPGDSLYKIAKKYNVTIDFIKKSNNLPNDVIRPGMKLRIYTGEFSIVVDKSQNILMLYADGDLIRTYKISTGKNNATPEGEFEITTKLKNPVFFKNGKRIAPGNPENILGTRWMGFSYGNGSYGIHGTTSPETIGTQETNGCVRMRNKDVEELYMIVPKGTKVKIVE